MRKPVSALQNSAVETQRVTPSLLPPGHLRDREDVHFERRLPGIRSEAINLCLQENPEQFCIDLLVTNAEF